MSTADALWARIAADPDGCDPDTYLVYADAIGGEVGERIVLMHAHRDGPVLAAHLEKHAAAVLGKRLAKHASIHWDWHLGFLRSVTYMSQAEDEREVIAEILALPAAALLRELVVFDRIGDPARYASQVLPPTLPAIDVVARVPDLETALRMPPEDVRWLVLEERGDDLPEALWQFTNVRWLELGQLLDPRDPAAHRQQLARLFRLEIEYCYLLAELPDALWAIESLHDIGTHDNIALQVRYKLARITPMLAGFARARTPPRRRIIEANFAIGHAARAIALASRDDLLAALDSNIGDVRAAALAELQRTLPDPLAEFPRDAVFALVGRTNYDKKALKAKLAARGAKLATKVTDDLTHAIVGESPAGKQHALPAGVVLVLEIHLAKALDAEVPALDTDAIRAQLRTRDEGRLAAAIAALQDGVDPSLFGDLVIVAQDTALAKKPREGAKKVLARYAPPAITAAMREHLKVSVLTEGMGEANRFARISGFVEQSGGAIDGLAFAGALVARARVGTQYVFALGTDADARAAIAAILAKADPPNELQLDLHALELSQLPRAIAEFPQIEAVYLYGNRFTVFPRELLDLPNLRKLDLTGNNVRDVPPELARLPIAWLSLARSNLTSFPDGVFALAGTLRELDVSSNQTYMPDEARIRGIPDAIRRLAKLARLAYRYNIIEEFPEGLFLLPELVELDLALCELPKTVPIEQLSRLPKLARLDLRYSSWRDRQAEINAVLPELEIVT